MTADVTELVKRLLNTHAYGCRVTEPPYEGECDCGMGPLLHQAATLLESTSGELAEARELLQVCLSCDLVYDWGEATGTREYGDDSEGPTVGDKVRAFLAENK